MTSHYTLCDVISHHDVTWIVLECCSCDFCVAMGCIPTLWFKKIKYSNKYIFISYNFNLEWLKTIKQSDMKTKQPSSGVLYGNIISFGVAEGSPSPSGLRWSFHHPKLSDITTQITRLRLFCIIIVTIG